MDYAILNELLTPTRITIMLLGCVPMFIGTFMYGLSNDAYARSRGTIVTVYGGFFAAIVILIVFGVFYMTNN